jgi:hypothetical protein
MKNLKVVLASLFLTVGIIALSSFAFNSQQSTAKNMKSAKFSGPWSIAYNAISNDPNDIKFIENYDPNTSITPCTGSDILCGIKVFDQDGLSSISPATPKQVLLDKIAAEIVANGVGHRTVVLNIGTVGSPINVTVELFFLS